MNYTFNQLRIFQKVCETGSITRAAEELHLTQPAVSIQLRNFQDQFDIPLTEVVSKRLHITEFGRRILTIADTILMEASAIEQQSVAFRGKLTGTLKIAVVSTGKYIMPYFLSGFMKQHPGIDLQLDVSNKSLVTTGLERNETDFSLVSVLPKNLRLKKIVLMENKLHLVGNNDKPWRTRPYGSEVFESNPLIYREKGSATRAAMEHFLTKLNAPLSKKIELTSNEAVKQAVIAGLGISIMPLIGIRNELRSGQLRLIPVKGLPIRTMWNLVWPEGKKHSPVASAFAAYLVSEKEAIIRKYFGDGESV
ncbi:MAG: LysR family transcriptional regulator [Bacteroidota bacterium]